MKKAHKVPTSEKILEKLEKVPENQDEVQIDGDNEESTDLFAEAYLNTLNESLDSLSPEKIRDKATEILPIQRGQNLGMNATVFSSNTGILDLISPKNGIKLRSK